MRLVLAETDNRPSIGIGRILFPERSGRMVEEVGVDNPFVLCANRHHAVQVVEGGSCECFRSGGGGGLQKTVWTAYRRLVYATGSLICGVKNFTELTDRKPDLHLCPSWVNVVSFSNTTAEKKKARSSGA